MTTLGAEIRQLRKRSGMTLVEVASAVGYTYPYLSDIETGKRSPPDATVARILAAIGAADELPRLLALAARARGHVVVPVTDQMGDEAVMELVKIAGGRSDTAGGGDLR